MKTCTNRLAARVLSKRHTLVSLVKWTGSARTELPICLLVEGVVSIELPKDESVLTSQKEPLCGISISGYFNKLAVSLIFTIKS